MANFTITMRLSGDEIIQLSIYCDPFNLVQFSLRYTHIYQLLVIIFYMSNWQLMISSLAPIWQMT